MGFRRLHKGVELGENSGAVDHIIVSGEGDHMIGFKKKKY